MKIIVSYWFDFEIIIFGYNINLRIDFIIHQMENQFSTTVLNSRGKLFHGNFKRKKITLNILL